MEKKQESDKKTKESPPAAKKKGIRKGGLYALLLLFPEWIIFDEK